MGSGRLPWAQQHLFCPFSNRWVLCGVPEVLPSVRGALGSLFNHPNLDDPQNPYPGPRPGSQGPSHGTPSYFLDSHTVLGEETSHVIVFPRGPSLAPTDSKVMHLRLVSGTQFFENSSNLIFFFLFILFIYEFSFSQITSYLCMLWLSGAWKHYYKFPIMLTLLQWKPTRLLDFIIFMVNFLNFS